MNPPKFSAVAGALPRAGRPSHSTVQASAGAAKRAAA